MRVSVGADHAGVELKQALLRVLDEAGAAVQDHGTSTTDSVDYPDFARLVADDVAAGRADRGILVCGSGVGMAIAANKVPGIRAAAIGDEEGARLAREHNDLNVLTLGARVTSVDQAARIVRVFLQTPFADGRHVRRVEKIRALENGR
jgi:ribose 5-phosphate isomerase B